MSSMWAFCRPSINIIIIITTISLQMFTTVMRWLAFTTMVVLSLVRLTDPSQTHGLQCFHNYKLSPRRRRTPSFIY